MSVKHCSDMAKNSAPDSTGKRGRQSSYQKSREMIILVKNKFAMSHGDRVSYDADSSHYKYVLTVTCWTLAFYRHCTVWIRQWVLTVHHQSVTTCVIGSSQLRVWSKYYQFSRACSSSSVVSVLSTVAAAAAAMLRIWRRQWWWTANVIRHVTIILTTHTHSIVS